MYYKYLNVHMDPIDRQMFAYRFIYGVVLQMLQNCHISHYDPFHMWCL